MGAAAAAASASSARRRCADNWSGGRRDAQREVERSYCALVVSKQRWIDAKCGHAARTRQLWLRPQLPEEASAQNVQIERAAVTVSRLQQQEMLPDVTRIARMHSVIVMAHLGSYISLLVHLLGDVKCLGRAGRVYIRQDAQGQVWVGGHTVTCIEGTALL